MRRGLLAAAVGSLLGWGALGCGGDDESGVDAGVGADAGSTSDGSTGGAAFLAACEVNGDCASNLCYMFNQAGVGLLCTMTCSSNAECPAPSSGCNNMGVCKRN